MSSTVISQLCSHQRSIAGSPPCAQSFRGGGRSHWDTLRRLTRQRFYRGGAVTGRGLDVQAQGQSWCSMRRGSYPPSKPQCHPSAQAYPASPRYNLISDCPCCSKPMSQCRVCYSDVLWEQSLNHSAPSVYSSALIGKKRRIGVSHHRHLPWCHLPPSFTIFSLLILSGLIISCFLLGKHQRASQRRGGSSRRIRSRSVSSFHPHPDPIPSRCFSKAPKPKPMYPHGSSQPHADSTRARNPPGPPRGARQAGESGRAEDHSAAGRQLHGEQHQGHQDARGEDGCSD